MAKKLTSKKAKEILHDKSVHGHPLTDKQRKFFGAIASGAPVKAQKGKKVIIDGKEYDTSDPAYKELYKWGDNPEGKGSIGYFDKEGRLVTSKTTLPEVVIWPKDKKTQKFYDELSDSEQYAFEQMTKKYGPVKVKEEEGSGIFSRSVGNYNPFTNTITLNPRNSINKFNVYLSELAHKKQFDEQGKFDVIGDWIFNDLPAYGKSKYYDIKYNLGIGDDFDNLLKASRASPYTNPSTVEYEAHSKYEPKLEDEAYDYRDEELFGENYNKFKKGGWLDKYEYGGQAGYTDIPFKYNSAWGGQFAMGGSLPGSVGFTYARTQGIPSEGPYAKKTMPSAQDGITDPLVPIEKGREELMNFYKMRPANLSGEQAAEKVKSIKTKKAKKNVLKRNAWEAYYDERKDELNYNPNLQQSVDTDLEEIAKHEFGHGVYEDLPSKEKDIIKSSIVSSDEFLKRNPLDNKEVIEYEKKRNYYTNPTEFYTRRNLLFDMFDIDPSKPITKEQANEMIGFRKYLDPNVTEEEALKMSKENPKLWNMYQKLIANPEGGNIMNFMNAIKEDPETYMRMFNEVTAVPGQQPSIARNGMTYYQHGLDWKPKTISRDGSDIPKNQNAKFVLPKYDMPRAANDSNSGLAREKELKLKRANQVMNETKAAIDSYKKAIPWDANLSDNEIIKKIQKANQISKNQGTIKKAEPKEGLISRAKNIATNPMTALAYKVKGQDIPEHFERGEKNILENVTNIINPLSIVDAAESIPGNIARGEFLEAGLNTLSVLPAAAELRGLAPEIRSAVNASKESGVLSKSKNLYNKIATGESILPVAWKSPAVGLSEEASQKMFSNLANSGTLTNSERALIAEYQANSRPFTGRGNWTVDQGKKDALNNIIKKYNLNVGDNTILTRKFNPTNNSLGANLENGVLNFGDRPTSFSAGVGNSGYASGAVDRVVLPSRYTKKMGSNLLVNEYGPLSEEALAMVGEDSRGFASTLGKSNKAVASEREVLGTGLKFKQIGKVKNDIGGYDWIVKPKQKQGGVIKDDRGQWAHPGEITEIQGNKMATHGYGDIPLYVVPDVGEPRMVEANTGTHTFPGATKFTEYPITQKINQKSTGDWLNKYK